MQLKISTTGKPSETKITNAETGEELVGVQHVEISISPFETLAVIVLKDFASNIITDKVEFEYENSESHD